LMHVVQNFSDIRRLSVARRSRMNPGKRGVGENIPEEVVAEEADVHDVMKPGRG